MKPKHGKDKAALELTDEEAAERLFGRRVVQKVRKELESPKPTEKTEKSVVIPSIEKKDR